MKAKIIIVDNANRVCAAITENNEFIILRLKKGYQPEIGDLITYNYIQPLSKKEYYNYTKDESFEAAFENVCLNQVQAETYCFNHLKIQAQ